MKQTKFILCFFLWLWSLPLWAETPFSQYLSSLYHANPTPQNQALLELYTALNFNFFWHNSPDFYYTIRHYVNQAEHEGLTAEDYQLPDHPPTPENDNVLSEEVAITRVLMQFACDLSQGRNLLKPLHNSHLTFRAQDVQGCLVKALQGHTVEPLKSLIPAHPQYTRLKTFLHRFQQLEKEGLWPQLSHLKTPIKPFTRHDDIPTLRQQLIRLKVLIPQQISEDPGFYDQELFESVKTFQALHGLEADGVIGSQTKLALNMTPYHRSQIIRLNMERWRQLPAFEETRFILVNVPGSILSVFEDDALIGHFPVVVGRTHRKTPLFMAPMTGIILNPSWHVPPTIAKDLLTKAKKDPTVFQKKGIRVLDRFSNSEINTTTINWHTLNHMPYKLWQPPGERNALGNIRFTLLNPFDIFIHGTPERQLFRKANRAQSSGCIRLEEPLTLLTLICKDHPEVRSESVLAALAEKKQKNISLPRPWPVIISYFTSWVTDQGSLTFYPDIYREDDTFFQKHPNF